MTALDAIRRGDATIEAMASRLEVPRERILEWLDRHKDEAWTSVAEIVGGGHAVRDLQRRLGRLLQLVDEAELELRILHQQVFAAIQATDGDANRSGAAR